MRRVCDREVKLPLYARATIPEVWLVDLAGERIEVCRRPSHQGYQEIRTARRGDRVASEAVSRPSSWPWTTSSASAVPTIYADLSLHQALAFTGRRAVKLR